MNEEPLHHGETEPGLKKASHPQARVQPERVGPYRIESFLASGGMSDLYVASHEETKEPVVVKVIKSRFAEQFEMKSRFMHEAEIIALADHPGIVKYYNHGIWEKGVYLAMEYVQGVSLRKFIQHTPLTLKRALEVVLEIGYAVCHLHTHGIIHRDLKLENVVVTDRGEVKLIDFGIARRVYELGQKGRPEQGQFIGTPSYMSPEQRDDPEGVSFPADIYSLGIMAYEIVLGKLSHGHVHLSLMPKGLQKILGKALQPNPRERYQDLVDFIGDLSSYMNVLIDSPNIEESAPLPMAIDALQSVVRELVPESVPKWESIQIDFSFHKGVGIAPIYFDFFFMDQHYFIAAEPSLPSAKGAIELAYFRGLERAFRPEVSHLERWYDLLLKTTLKDPFHPLYSMGLIRLNLKEKRLEFVGTGEVRLFLLGKEGVKSYTHLIPPLGSVDAKVDIFHSRIQNGDLLIFSTSPLVDGALHSVQGVQDLKEHKRVTEHLMRKAKVAYSQEFDKKSILIVSFKINGL